MGPGRGGPAQCPTGRLAETTSPNVISRAASLQRDPDSKEPEAPTTHVGSPNRNGSVVVPVERLVVAPRLIDVTRRSVPSAVPATRRRRTVPAALRGRTIPIARRSARRRAVIPTGSARRRRRRRTVSRCLPAAGRRIARAALCRWSGGSARSALWRWSGGSALRRPSGPLLWGRSGGSTPWRRSRPLLCRGTAGPARSALWRRSRPLLCRGTAGPARSALWRWSAGSARSQAIRLVARCRWRSRVRIPDADREC
jgi:hypothetical protein